MSGDDWRSKVKEAKRRENEIEADVKDDKKAWEEHREKHKDEAKRIIELLNSVLKDVVEVYSDKSAQSYYKPSVIGDDRYVNLNIPIVRPNTYISFGIAFYLNLTEKGYRVDVSKSDGISKSIFPPITEEAIRKEVMDFLDTRNREIARMAEVEKRFHKERV